MYVNLLPTFSYISCSQHPYRLVAAAAAAAARPPSRAQQPIVPAHGVRPPGERAERQSLTSDSGRGGSMENCMAHSTAHMNVFNEYPGT